MLKSSNKYSRGETIEIVNSFRVAEESWIDSLSGRYSSRGHYSITGIGSDLRDKSLLDIPMIGEYSFKGDMVMTDFNKNTFDRIHRDFFDRIALNDYSRSNILLSCHHRNGKDRIAMSYGVSLRHRDILSKLIMNDVSYGKENPAKFFEKNPLYFNWYRMCESIFRDFDGGQGSFDISSGKFSVEFRDIISLVRFLEKIPLLDLENQTVKMGYTFCWIAPTTATGTLFADDKIRADLQSSHRFLCDLVGENAVSLDLMVDSSYDLLEASLSDSSLLARESFECIVGSFKDEELGSVEVFLEINNERGCQLMIEDEHAVLGGDVKAYSLAGIEFK